jgi:hypothetical protein
MQRRRWMNALALAGVLSAMLAPAALAAPTDQQGRGHGNGHRGHGNGHRGQADAPIVVVPSTSVQAPIVVPAVPGQTVVSVPAVQTFPGVQPFTSVPTLPGVQTTANVQPMPVPVLVPVPVPSNPDLALPNWGAPPFPPLPPAALPGFQNLAMPALQQFLPPGAFQQSPPQLFPLPGNQFAVSHPLLFCSFENAATCETMAEQLAEVVPGFGTAVMDGPDGYGVYLTYQG